MYIHVLGTPPEALGELVRAKRPQRIPAVLTPDEVSILIGKMNGTPALMAALLYGAGLRLMSAAACA